MAFMSLVTDSPVSPQRIATGTPGSEKPHSIKDSRPERPEWIRLPRAGERCPHTNFCRSGLWRFTVQQGIPSFAVRKPGAIKGARFIHLPSLLAAMERLAAAESQTTAGLQTAPAEK